MINSESYFPQLREYCPRAFGTMTSMPVITICILISARHRQYKVRVDIRGGSVGRGLKQLGWLEPAIFPNFGRHRPILSVETDLCRYYVAV